MTFFGIAVLILLGAQAGIKFWLERLNRNYTRQRAGRVPEAFAEYMDEATYRRSIEYSLAKSRLYEVEVALGAVLLIAVLFSGVLPWSYHVFSGRFGTSAASMSAYLIAAALVLALLDLPLEWHRQFHLEERFGFNTTSARTWWLDRVKGALLTAVLGYPLLMLILYLTNRAGSFWWLWAWAAMIVFQLAVTVLAPVLILPLFNTFTPLPPGALRDRLEHLARRTGFKTHGVQVMDGSKRSLHSNAFFIGFGRFRKIVFFDTLLEQLDEPEVEAVLAHEIGHYKLRHIPKMLFASSLSTLAAFYVVAWLAGRNWFFTAFEFESSSMAIALLLFGLLSGLATFWLSPAMHWWSRRHEYQADGYAAKATSEVAPMIQALRKLSKKNLSNLTPHPFYSRFYYSHPTLLEREAALRSRQSELVSAT